MKRCGMCGGTDLKNENIKGARYPWRDHLFVELAYDQNVLVCQNCKNRIMSSKNIVELENNIKKTLWDKVKSAIYKLTHELGLSQEQLADALGVTPQYISMVKSGKKVFSFTAFNLLQTYSDHPNLLTKYTGIPINLTGYNVNKEIDVIGAPSVMFATLKSRDMEVVTAQYDLEKIIKEKLSVYTCSVSRSTDVKIEYRQAAILQEPDEDDDMDEIGSAYIDNLKAIGSRVRN